MKLTAEQRIERVHVNLMQSKRFCQFSGVFMVGKVSVSDACKTASTNGRDVTYGRSFVDVLTDKQLGFLVLHEAMHKAYRHMTVWADIAKIDRQLANQAMDYVINLQIRDTDPYEEEVAMPRDPATGKALGLIDDRFAKMDTKQVFDILREEADDGDGGGGGGDSGDGGGQNEGGSGSPGDSGDDELDDHDWDNAQSMSEEEKEELTREIDAALREGAMLAGRMKGNLDRNIDHLLHPKVDWKEALRDFVKLAMKGNDQSTWRRPSRRFLGVDIVMPTSQSHKAEMFVLAIDTSGSIGGEALAQFLGEVKAICDEVTPEAIELLYWDSHVAGRETYRGADVQRVTESTKPVGGGGTTPGCVPAYMAEKDIKPQCVIVLTDGYFLGGDCGDWSGVSAPVLWCVKGRRDFVPTVGQSVYVEA
jgi:predicted metal-dependent peptidase